MSNDDLDLREGTKENSSWTDHQDSFLKTGECGIKVHLKLGFHKIPGACGPGVGLRDEE